MLDKVLPKKFLKRRSDEFLKLPRFRVSKCEDCERIILTVMDAINCPRCCRWGSRFGDLEFTSHAAFAASFIAAFPSVEEKIGSIKAMIASLCISTPTVYGGNTVRIIRSQSSHLLTRNRESFKISSRKVLYCSKFMKRYKKGDQPRFAPQSLQ